jgi:lysophospholipase L1-like esterase
VRPRRVLVTAAVAATALVTSLVTTLTMTAGAASGALSKPLPAAPPPVRYVALGDSYSAGTGAGPYSAAGRSCERSASAYPQLWASQHTPASFVSVACAGATTATVLDDQLSALSGGTTLVSLTIGGNDVGFSNVMETCVLEWNSACQDAVTKAEREISTTLPGHLDSVLRAIHTRAPLARIVLLGYPDLYDLTRSASCLGIGTSKRTALNQGADALDRALSAAAARNDAVFADVRPDFAGHEICDSATHYLNAITWPIDSSYHPTAAGQRSGYLPAFTAAQP